VSAFTLQERQTLQQFWKYLKKCVLGQEKLLNCVANSSHLPLPNHTNKKNAIKVPNLRIIFFCNKKLNGENFCKKHFTNVLKKNPDSEQHLKTWYDTVMSSDWETPNDEKKTYANASILKNNRVVFNIKGNTYRLVVKFNFEKQWVFIKFIGTHAEYDKIDVNKI